MTLEHRIEAFAQLGNKITTLSADELNVLTGKVRNENPWFTPESTLMALRGISKFLTKEALQNWTNNYSLANSSGKRVGVAMPGNIPLVGFQDRKSVV